MNTSLAALRNRAAGTAEFRHAADRVCEQLMRDAKENLVKQGIEGKDVVIVVILRAALAFLNSGTHVFPDAPVGVLGMKRDEQTLEPRWYYENLPPISQESTILMVDPMLATGGSAVAAVERLKTLGADAQKIHFVGVIAAPEGVARLSSIIPKENIAVAATDGGLDDHGMIVPGLGDFGDRYFGHGGQAIIEEK